MGSAAQFLDWFRTIEAEYLTAQQSQTKPVNDWLELEAVEEEIGAFDQAVAAGALEAFKDVGRRFGFEHGATVRLTVLAQETDAPWLHGRYGYCTAKNEFYKICIPLAIVGDKAELGRTLRHEYAHVVVGTLAAKKAPRWMDEAVAMAAENSSPRSLASSFASKNQEWLKHGALEAAFRTPQDSEELWLAYAQAGLIGLYLSTNFGESKLGDMLRAFGDNSFMGELKMRVLGETADQEAVQQAFGLKLPELFQRAHDWARAGRF